MKNEIELVVLYATSVGLARRHRLFLCTCSRNYICGIIIIIVIIIIKHCICCCGDDASKSPNDGSFFWLLLI